MEKITVTAIVSVYNGEKFLNKCIESLLNQTQNFDEIILYDDKSTDNTPNIIKKYYKNYPEKFKIIISDINRGPGGGKNEAMKLATKDYILFVDADDYLDNDYLEKIVSSFSKETYKNLDIIFTGFKQVTEEGTILYKREFENIEKALYSGISNWGKLFSRKFIIENKIEIPSGKVLDDVLTRAIMVCCNPKCLLIKNNYGYNYVKNKSSVTNTYMKKFIPGVAELEFNYLYSNKDKILEKNIEIYEYYVYKIYCWHLLKSGSNVGKVEMTKEYEKMNYELKNKFPNYIKNKYLNGKYKLKGERRIVSYVVKMMYILEKMKLQKYFLWLYSSFDFSYFWPKM